MFLNSGEISILVFVLLFIVSSLTVGAMFSLFVLSPVIAILSYLIGIVITFLLNHFFDTQIDY